MVDEVSWVHNRQILLLKYNLFLILLKRYYLENEVNLRWKFLGSGGNTSVSFVAHITKIHSLCARDSDWYLVVTCSSKILRDNEFYCILHVSKSGEAQVC